MNCSAEALDNHLTAIQRDHEHKSQIEERRIRDDAAIEEAKRREKTFLEEKLRQEKVRYVPNPGASSNLDMFLGGNPQSSMCQLFYLL